jgi:hypothetical protein
MTQPAAPGSVDWQRRWTIGAGVVTLQPVTHGIAQAVLSGAPHTRRSRICRIAGFAHAHTHALLGIFDRGSTATMIVDLTASFRYEGKPNRRRPQRRREGGGQLHPIVNYSVDRVWVSRRSVITSP